MSVWVRSRRVLLGATAIIVVLANTSHAAVVTFGFTFAPLAGYTSEAGTGIRQFDPTLGTLTGISFDIADSATFSNGPVSATSTIDMLYTLPGFFLGTQLLSLGNGFVSRTNATNVVPGFLFPSFATVYTGTSLLPTSVAVSLISNDPVDLLTTFGADTVHYAYDPAGSAIPEPSSLIMFGASVTGAAFMLKRRNIFNANRRVRRCGAISWSVEIA